MADVPVWAPGQLKQPGDLVRATNSGVVTQPPLDNPDMDAGDSGWTESGFGSFDINTDAPLWNGTHSMKLGFLSNPNAQTLNVVNDELLPVTPGQIVTLRFKIYSVIGGDYARLMPRIQWYGAGGVGQPLTPTTYPLDPTNVGGEARVNAAGISSAVANSSWFPVEFSGVAPAGAAFWTAQLSATWGDSAWAVDDFTYAYAYTEEPNTLIFRAVQAAAGFTGNTEPTWPETIGQQVVDNDVTWEAVSGNSVTWQASRILVSGGSEPTWPEQVNTAVPDNTMQWTLDSRRVTDANVPTDSSVVIIASSKVFAADDDIISYSATVNPLDWSSRDDAGYIPFGLQQYGNNPATAMGLYRGNLAIFNSEGCQLWQLDEDPAGIAYLDAIPVSCTFPKSVQPVGDDLAFLSNLGIRSLGLSGSSVNLQGGFFGQQVDPLVLPALEELVDANGEPIGLYWPARGQYWLFFAEQAFVLTINGGPGEKKLRSWSRYVFPWAIDDWTIQGTDLVLRAGDLVLKVDPSSLVDDQHEVVEEVQLDLDTSTQYGTNGWNEGASSIVLGFTHNYPVDTPVAIFGQPRRLPFLVAAADDVPGGSTTQAIATSFDDGETWTARTTPASAEYIGVAASETRNEVLALTQVGAIVRSVDGVTFTALTNDIGNGIWTDLARDDANGLYIAVGQDSVNTAQRCATSPDGVTWTRRTIPNRDWLRLHVNTVTGVVTAMAASFTTTPMATSEDGGVTWASIPALGGNTDISNATNNTTTGKFVASAAGDAVSLASTDMASFASTNTGMGGSHCILYLPGVNRYIVSGSGGLASADEASSLTWVSRSTAAAYQNLWAGVWTIKNRAVLIRPPSGAIADARVIFTEDGINLSNEAPAGLAASRWRRLIQANLQTSTANGANTVLFADTTASGDEGDEGVSTSHDVIAHAGDALIIQYPVDGPFTVTDGNEVGSEELELSDGLELYLKALSPVRITHASGTDYNYLAEDVEAGATTLPLLFPLAAVATAVRVLPYGSLLLNANNIEVAYVAIEISEEIYADFVPLERELPADAVDLPMIIRPMQWTTVAGGAGTSSVTLEDVTAFENDASYVPQTGFPAAPVIIGDWVSYEDGTPFVGVIQWPFIDMRNPGADKELTGFDLVIDGECEVSVGYDQRELAYDPAGAWTEALLVDGDTLPAEPQPYSVTAPTFSLRLEFSAEQAWEWFAANLYVKDLNT